MRLSDISRSSVKTVFYLRLRWSGKWDWGKRSIPNFAAAHSSPNLPLSAFRSLVDVDSRLRGSCRARWVTRSAKYVLRWDSMNSRCTKKRWIHLMKESITSEWDPSLISTSGRMHRAMTAEKREKGVLQFLQIRINFRSTHEDKLLPRENLICFSALSRE